MSSDSAIGTASAIVCAGKSCSAIATSPKARSRSTQADLAAAAVGERRGEVGGQRGLAAAALGGEHGDDAATRRPAGSGRRLRRRLLPQRGRQVGAALDGGLDPQRVPLVHDLADAGPERVLQQRRRHLDADQDDAEARPVDAHVVGEREGLGLADPGAEDDRVLVERRGQVFPQRLQAGEDLGHAAERLPERLGGGRVRVADDRDAAHGAVTSFSFVGRRRLTLGVLRKDGEVQLTGLLAEDQLLRILLLDRHGDDRRRNGVLDRGGGAVPAGGLALAGVLLGGCLDGGPDVEHAHLRHQQVRLLGRAVTGGEEDGDQRAFPQEACRAVRVVELDGDAHLAGLEPGCWSPPGSRRTWRPE